MPKVLVIGTVDKIGPWIEHLKSTVQNVQAVKPTDLSYDQQHGIAKCQDIDAVFVVVISDDLDKDCAKIKGKIQEGFQYVPEETPVFIVFAHSSENSLNKLKPNFSLVEGTNEATREKSSFYQVGKQTPKYVSDVFAYRSAQHNSYFSEVKEVLTPEYLKKARGIKQIKLVSKSSNSSSNTTDTEEKELKPRVMRMGATDDNDQDNEKEDTLKRKENSKQPPHQKTQPSAQPRNVIIIEQPLDESRKDRVGKQNQTSESKTTVKHGDRKSLEKASNHNVPASQTPKALLNPRVSKPWEIDLPFSIMALTLAGLGVLVTFAEWIALGFGASLIMKSGLLATAIVGTALASLTPAGVVLVGIAVVALIVGIATFCYCNRERLFGISSGGPARVLRNDESRAWFERSSEEQPRGNPALGNSASYKKLLASVKDNEDEFEQIILTSTEERPNNNPLASTPTLSPSTSTDGSDTITEEEADELRL